MKTVIRSIILALCFSAFSVKADNIYLKGDKVIYGQLIKVTDKYLIVEVVSNRTGKVNNISLDKNDVLRVDDESSRTIYSGGRILYPLRNYYNNKDGKIKLIPVDRIYPKVGKDFLGKILTKQGSFFLIRNYDQNRQFLTAKFDTTEIILVKKNAGFAQERDPYYSSVELNKIPEYPDFTVGISFGTVQTNYDEIRDRIQYYYDNNDSLKNVGIRADKINPNFRGLRVQLGLRFTNYLKIGLSGFTSLNTEDHALSTFSVQVSYIYNIDIFHPWISLGYALQSSKIKQDVNKIISEHGYNRYTLQHIEWLARDQGLIAGIGVEMSKETGIGLQISAEYLPFSRKSTEITAHLSNYSLESSFYQKVDMSLLLFTVGLTYKY